MVEARKRITARHIRELEKSGMKSLGVPDTYLHGRALARDLVDMETGEVLASANEEVTKDLLEKFREIGVESFEIIYTNDLDKGPYISDTLRADDSKSSLRLRSKSIA